MDPEEMQAVITELEQQRSIMGARAAEYARMNYRLMKELKEHKQQLEMLTPKDPGRPQEINGEDRQSAERFNG